MAVFTLRPHARSAKRVLACIVAVMATLLVGPQVGSAADTTPAIEFADSGTLSLSAKMVEVELVNNTTSLWQLRATAYLDIVDDNPTNVTIPVDVPASLQPGSSAIVTVGPAPVGVGAGSGFVVVTATNGGAVAVARRAVTAGPSAPEPRVDSWAATNQGDWTVSGAAHGMPLLALSDPGCGSLGADAHDVFLTSGSDVATLTYKCVPVAAGGSGDATLAFAEKSIPEVGQYAGTLKVGDTSVSLSYTVAAWIGWAILVIAIGLWAGIWRQVYSNGSPIRRADKRVTQIGYDAIERQRQFEDRARTASFLVYRINQGAAQEVARLERALAEQWPRLTSITGLRAAFWTKDPDELDAVLKDAAALDQTVRHWPSVADDLRALAATVAAITGAGPLGEPVTPGDFAPLLVAHARDVLAPTGASTTEKALTIKEAGALSEEVPKLNNALKLLPTVVELYGALDSPDPPDELRASDKEVWLQARRLMQQARSEFAVATDVARLEQAKVDDLVKQSQAYYWQVAPKPAPAEQSAEMAAFIEGGPARAAAVPVIGDIGRLLGTAWSGITTRSVGTFWVLAAIALAFWSGLTTYWFDKPWGRPADYVVLFVWAFGATTLVAPILSALEDFIGRPTPLKKPDDKAG